MNKLEKQIFDAMMAGCEDYCDYDTLSRIAAKIALELAEKAFYEGRCSLYDFEDFKKDIL